MHPQHDPLIPQQWAALQQLTAGITAEQLLWIKGYLAGFGDARRSPGEAPATQVNAVPPEIAILYGSQTGNAEKLAHELQTRLSSSGVSARLEAMSSYKTARLKRDRFLLLIVSTHGEGDPPDNARPFHEFLHSRKAPGLEGVHFSVLALGDTSYEFFCKTGRDFDTRLAELGASRLHERVDCDVDYEESAERWIEGVVMSLRQRCATVLASAVPAPLETVSAWSKRNPFPASLVENLRLTGRGSSKDVRHIELSLEGSGLHFEPGDSLGVVVSNWPERVADLLSRLGLDASAPLTGPSGRESSLENALLNDYEITTITRPFLERYAEISAAGELRDLLKEENRTALRDFVHGREILDVVQRYPVPGISAAQFIGILRRLPPRLYSIASSYNASPDEVHLTVAVVRYESYSLPRQGVASTFLADRVPEGGTVPVYVDGNPNFRLPADPEAPLIMVGPGTGVAPFRAFLAEREAVGATGRNWLFFGDRNFHSDFLYQVEWLDYRQKGLLNRIDVAFSRDSERKVYVQHRMLERSRELYRWIEEGAYVYVCGDAQRMAPDVHQALIQVVEKEGGHGRERAEEYVNELLAGRRYQRDVY